MAKFFLYLLIIRNFKSGGAEPRPYGFYLKFSSTTSHLPMLLPCELGGQGQALLVEGKVLALSFAGHGLHFDLNSRGA